MTKQTEYWTAYYDDLLQNPAPWLDYSNDRVQAQSFALVLEAAGPVTGRSCLDFGCGQGQLARILHGLGASRTVGVDGMEQLLDANRQAAPDIEWQLSTEDSPHLATPFDLMFFVEVLQCLPSLDVLTRHWAALRPGGRIVGLLPNAECPIVAKTTERLEGNYTPRRFDELSAIADQLDGLESSWIRGIAFQTDQRLLPYTVSPWCSDRAPEGPPPNRWQFVFVKANTAST